MDQLISAFLFNDWFETVFFVGKMRITSLVRGGRHFGNLGKVCLTPWHFIKSLGVRRISNVAFAEQSVGIAWIRETGFHQCEFLVGFFFPSHILTMSEI